SRTVWIVLLTMELLAIAASASWRFLDASKILKENVVPARHPLNERTTLRGHAAWVTAIAFATDGRTLASAGDKSDGTVKLWDPVRGTELAATRLDSSPVTVLAFSEPANVVVAGCRDGALVFLDGTTLK